ncbi:MAG: MurT ligase domain-containing protein [Actinomycetaceae bacterium]|nr:MurT ligase domain-containing protein [Actinomycetaceae bacterium]
MPFRSRSAVAFGRCASRLSRLSGKGAGGMIGGRVAQKLAPDVVSDLAAGRQCVIVTGTNGKSTTTAMVQSALKNLGEVACNANGDNLTSGVITALMNAPDAPYAVLEVDEMHVAEVAKAVKPKAFILLNLSRDQLDRVGEIGVVERSLRQVIHNNPQAYVIANCDDPLIASIAWDAPKVIWVSVGAHWTQDSTSFPRGGGIVLHEENSWRVPGTQYSRPEPHWIVEGDELVDTTNNKNVCHLELHVPGQANKGNAGQAIVAAYAMGVDLTVAAQSVGTVCAVAGRYTTYTVKERSIHMLLAKNPAGWQEALSMLDKDTDNLIISVNGQVADSTDLSWLWDVAFETLVKRYNHVVACGDRGRDLAVRLDYAGINVTYCDSLEAALMHFPAHSRIEFLANYTAFRDAKIMFDKVSEGRS